MSLSSKNFVNVNISHYQSTSVSGSRNICVLIDSDASIDEIAVGTDVYWSSVSEYIDSFLSEDDAAKCRLYNYVLAFFNNGGQKLHYIKVNGQSGTSAQINNANAALIVEAISELPTDEIVIAGTCSNVVMQIVATTLNNNSKYTGIDEKILLTYLHSLTVVAKACKAVVPTVQPVSDEDLSSGDYYTREADTTGVGYLHDSNYAYTKVTSGYSSKTTYYILKYIGNDAYENPLDSVANLSNIVVKAGPQGIEMTVLAYLSQINVYRGTISDYCYTSEVVSMFEATLSDGIDENTGILVSPIVDDDATFEALKKANINCTINLPSNGVMEYGGNKTDGTDLVNDFVRIVLTQTLTDRIIGVLTNKLRYNQTGLGLVSAAMTDELQKYKAFGYLANDKTWTKGDLYDDTGDILIVSNDTPLPQGYLFKILPFSSLTAQDIANHLLPQIYLLIADSYSIRAIEISGQVF